MGLNSLMALELVRHLSATTGVRLPATAVFNHPTIVLLGRGDCPAHGHSAGRGSLTRESRMSLSRTASSVHCRGRNLPMRKLSPR